ncbi:chromosome partitioning protein [Bathymodiolus platifrons methanotrophic gill symbiont]|uniref:AAA family ATPase n=1 Tax=Bathymodiolus platifrons methanotrophic gill symbiont TaxID=113268 RepID=UPI000B40C121|nr:AAA family ATPase [Bathymodiolus platifrons methanotrophic gill symbiont]GAW86312.1 chromosome partitioning protein [Bathymodiolus platifrons methanotrophic gill symbiont]GFO73855.1 chromosome partitioning protein [Bathymodiolus platifrons methanotrophic gill symbiont]
MVILIGGEKGGTGKTTIATNLAAMRSLAGRDVLLIDTDPQGSANYWAQSRDEENINPRVACVQKFGKGLPKEVQDLATRYQDIIIDAGGRDSVELRSALVVTERLFVPIQPSQFDIWTLNQMEELVETAKAFNSDLIAKVIISRSSTNPSVHESDDTGKLLNDFDNLDLADVTVRDRIAYRKAAKDGLAVIELKPKDQKAVKEMQALYKEVFGDE